MDPRSYYYFLVYDAGNPHSLKKFKGTLSRNIFFLSYVFYAGRSVTLGAWLDVVKKKKIYKQNRRTQNDNQEVQYD